MSLYHFRSPHRYMQLSIDLLPKTMSLHLLPNQQKVQPRHTHQKEQDRLEAGDRGRKVWAEEWVVVVAGPH